MDIIDDVLDGTVPVTGIDINSGTLDNVVIGGATANSGTFTVLSATTSLGVTGNITVSGTVDGVDIATRDAVLTSTTTTANAALPKAGGIMTGAITFAAGQTFDGRDVSADGAKLDGIESGATADQTKADIDALGIAASTAATLATARNIALTGDVSGSASFNGSANISITATVADDSHNHVISNIDGLQTALDGKASSTGSLSNNFSARTVYLQNLEKSNLSTDGQLGFDSSQGLLVYRTQQGTTGTVSVLDGANVDAGTGVSITNTGTGGTGTESFTFSIGQDVATSASPTFAGLTITNQLEMSNSLDMNNFDIYGVDQIFHHGDTNTYIQFHAADQFRVVTGGSERLEVNNTRTQADRLFVTSALAENDVALSGTSVTADPDSGGAFYLTMTGNTTFTFGAPALGNVSTGFIIELTGNGSTVTWPTSVDWAGGTAPDAPASGETDIYVFWTRNGGTTWYGVQSIDAAA